MQTLDQLDIGAIEEKVRYDRLTAALTKAASNPIAESESAIVEQMKKSSTEIIEWPYSVTPSDLAALYDEEPTHHACVDVKAAATISNGYKILHSSGEPKSPPSAMIRDFDALFPNGIEDLITKAQTDYETMGNAWIEIVRDNAGRVRSKGSLGKVVELNHIPAYTMFVLNPNVADKMGSYVQVTGREKVYFRKFGTPGFKYKGQVVNEAIHLKYYTPSHYFYGLPPIWSAINAAMANRLDGQNNIEFQEDKGLARYMLIMDGAHTMIDPKDEAILTNYMNALMEKRSVKLIVVGTPAGTDSKFQRLKDDPHFDHLLNVRNANRDEICRVEQVPPRLIGIISPGALGATGEGESQFDLFKRLVVRPRQNMWERTFDKIFFSQIDRRKMWRIELNEVDLADFLRREQANVGYVRSGVFSINQVLSRLGAPVIGPEGDKRFIISGGVPVELGAIGNAGAAPAADPNAQATTPQADASQGGGNA